jgi:transcriptional regulator with XRE-family HTH domain
LSGGFDEERAMAERGLEDLRLQSESTTDEDVFPPTAERFRKARARLGLSDAEVAARWGVRPSEYWDLERYNSEVFTCVGVEELTRLARILGTPLMELLFGARPPTATPPVSYRELARRMEDRATGGETTLPQLSEEVGWDLGPIVHDPDALGAYTLSGLYDICKSVDADWVAVLMFADARAVEHRGAADERRDARS